MELLSSFYFDRPQPSPLAGYKPITLISEGPTLDANEHSARYSRACIAAKKGDYVCANVEHYPDNVSAAYRILSSVPAGNAALKCGYLNLVKKRHDLTGDAGPAAYAAAVYNAKRTVSAVDKHVDCHVFDAHPMLDFKCYACDAESSQRIWIQQQVSIVSPTGKPWGAFVNVFPHLNGRQVNAGMIANPELVYTSLLILKTLGASFAAVMVWDMAAGIGGGPANPTPTLMNLLRAIGKDFGDENAGSTA